MRLVLKINRVKNGQTKKCGSEIHFGLEIHFESEIHFGLEIHFASNYIMHQNQIFHQKYILHQNLYFASIFHFASKIPYGAKNQYFWDDFEVKRWFNLKSLKMSFGVIPDDHEKQKQIMAMVYIIMNIMAHFLSQLLG